MNKDAIIKTAYLHHEDGDYVVESPLCEWVMGVGETPEKAWEIFHEILDESYELYLEGRFKTEKYSRPGRPSLGKVRLNLDIDPDVKSALAGEAKALGISQGALVEALFIRYRKAQA